MTRDSENKIRRGIRDFYRVLAMLPVLREVLKLAVVTVLAVAAMGAPVVLMVLFLGPLIGDTIATTVLGQLAHQLLDAFVETINMLPSIESEMSSGWTSAESSPTDDPSQWRESESVWWPVVKTFRTMLFYLLFMAVWAMFISHQIGEIDSSAETDRIEPMDLDELEEHYKERYMNDEITEDEFEERIEIVHECKGMEGIENEPER